MSQLQKEISTKCVFILGCDRSGTTLLRTLLNRHSCIWITYEAPAAIVLKDVFRKSGAVGVIDALQSFPQFNEVNWPMVSSALANDATFATTIEAVYKNRIDSLNKTIWGDKTPAYTGFINDLNQLFPECLFIHVVRDPRAVAKSWVKADWGPNTFFHAGREWANRVGEALSVLSMIPANRVATVRYEDMISSPQTVLRMLCTYLGVPFEVEMLNCDGKDEALPNDYLQSLHDRTTKVLDVKRVDRWQKLPEHAVKLIESSSWDLMQKLGYTPHSSSKPAVGRAELLLYRVKNRVITAIHCRRRNAPGPRFPLPRPST